MSAKPLEQIALEHLITNMLDADEDWLVQHTPTNYSYWQNTLETQISAAANEDGSIKLRAATIIATNVDDEKLAERVCASLNYLACSWAFAYDYDEKAIKALSSLNLYIHDSNEAPTRRVVEPQPFQNAWFTIFTNIIWAQNAMAAELASEIAKAAEGHAAHSQPANQAAPRSEPDVFNHIPEVLRQRPEWVMDIRPYTQWPSFELIGQHLVSAVDEEPSEESWWMIDEANQQNCWLSNATEDGALGRLAIGHFQDFRYGESFSALHTIARPSAFSDLELPNRANLLMFNLESTTQFGNWRFSNESFTFGQSIPAAFIRSIESSAGAAALGDYNPVFFARLVGFAKNLEEFVIEIDGVGTPKESSDDHEKIEKQAHQFIKTLENPALELLFAASNRYEDAIQNPLIFRGESFYNFFTICVFNPIGPTIHSLEAYGAAGNHLFVVDTMRHPLYPAYLPLGLFDPTSHTILNIFESSIDRMFNHIPDYLFMDSCPKDIRTSIDGLIKTKLLNLAHEQNINVQASLTRLKALNQSPWQRVDHDLEPLPEATSPATNDQVEGLFNYITSPENTVLFWHHVPDTWDGSLNNASGNGFIDSTGVGPLFWAYDKKVGAPSKSRRCRLR
jgi:hypothetical protein